jgi:hypothetical protein
MFYALTLTYVHISEYEHVIVWLESRLAKMKLKQAMRNFIGT